MDRDDALDYPMLYEMALAENERLRTIIRDAAEALERGSTSAPVLELLRSSVQQQCDCKSEEDCDAPSAYRPGCVRYVQPVAPVQSAAASPLCMGLEMGEFKPCVMYSDELRITEVLLEDTATVWCPWGPYHGHAVDCGYAMDDGRLVGIKIWDDVRCRAADPKLQDETK